jgi:hypothetical protein
MTPTRLPPSNRAARRCFTLLLTPLLLLGCQGSNSGSSADATADAAKAQDAKPNYQVIRRSRAPLSVVVAAGGRLQVVDLADEGNNRINKVILDTKLAPNSVVTLNAATGVTINAQPTKAKGPLNGKHTYEFRLMQ